ncbi:unnamed protein product [Tenebrio molitor]|nr:unnamed protein product [Tenebrio molitor]
MRTQPHRVLSCGKSTLADFLLGDDRFRQNIKYTFVRPELFSVFPEKAVQQTALSVNAEKNYTRVVINHGSPRSLN